MMGTQLAEMLKRLVHLVTFKENSIQINRLKVTISKARISARYCAEMNYFEEVIDYDKSSAR